MVEAMEKTKPDRGGVREGPWAGGCSGWGDWGRPKRSVPSGRFQSCDAHHSGQMGASGRKELMHLVCALGWFISALKEGKNIMVVNVTILPLALRDSVFSTLAQY